MSIHTAALLLISVFITASGFAQPNNVDEIYAGPQLPENTGQNAGKGFYLNHLFFRNVHMCHGPKTLAECAAPDKVSAMPNLYVAIWSPIAQDYEVVFLVTDISGTVYYMQSIIWADAQAQSYWHGMHWNEGVLDVLPEGNYKVFSFVIGKADGQLALSEPYTFHKLENVKSRDYYQD